MGDQYLSNVGLPPVRAAFVFGENGLIPFRPLLEVTISTDNYARFDFAKMSSNEGIFHSMGDKAQELSNATQEKIGNAGQAVKDTVQSGYDKVTQGACDAAQAVKDTAQSGYDRVTQAGRDAYDAVAGKAEDGKEAAAEKTDEARDYMARKMKEGADVIQAH
ncbi:hypothetical protein Y032_0603g528 [Ancylostoma ceylanicum]|uniref:Late embryogeneis abundant protein n=3 Tax=Ancylostoma ceylanicum TaxID=53326 RepID=A0A016WLG0_9BILA|nr:hypothetical protein Y032_0603g528 [Ancylostoma ceylanicum]